MQFTTSSINTSACFFYRNATGDRCNQHNEKDIYSPDGFCGT
ncbi:MULTISPECIES: hypothetical protein [unclassified Leptolyngbya]|nr:MULTISPECIES: hypothetical protein [unclassified Leptolyngbya]